MADGFDTEFFAERFGLRDLTVIVTGAGSGLGRQAARTLAATGAHIALLGRRTEQTDINRAMFQTPAGKKIVEGLPRQRLGTPAALDSALLMLASPASAFVTGSTLVIDDGQRFSIG